MFSGAYCAKSGLLAFTKKRRNKHTTVIIIAREQGKETKMSGGYHTSYTTIITNTTRLKSPIILP